MSRVSVAVRAFRRRRPTALAAALLALLMLIPSVASTALNPYAIPDVDATWDCDDGLVVTSTKDISNLVLVVDGEPVSTYERGIDDEPLRSYTADTELIGGDQRHLHQVRRQRLAGSGEPGARCMRPTRGTRLRAGAADRRHPGHAALARRRRRRP